METVTTFVRVGAHRLEATVFGAGLPTVVLEPGFGGDAASWRAVAEELAAEVTVVTYDRAPYGNSSPAVDGRTPREIATDLHGVLASLPVQGPYVLVAHSSGGRIIRQFAAMYDDQVAGMVLVDSSHEDQQRRLGPTLPWRFRLNELLTIPRIYLDRSSSLAVRRSMARELRALNRQTAADIPLAPGALNDRPLIVLTRSSDEALSRRGWQMWHELHYELAVLSTNSRHVIAGTPEHFIHTAEPELVIAAIRDVLHSARNRTPLPA